MFFEKLAAMFEKIAHELPKFQTLLGTVRKDREPKGPNNGDARLESGEARLRSHQCLLRAAAYIYVDLLQFCLSVCRLFSTTEICKYIFKAFDV
jgi:hypothetical protein